ncbi:MAG: UTP--glucose-1-phosphate uridylyltransferase GalU [Burkholderiaceae bacterium]
MNQPTLNKAVFPVAGLGTRFLPATKAQPKEMLPIVDKPLIQYAVEEAYEAGIRHMIFVTGRSKRAIEDHFDTAYELENELEMAGKESLLSLIRDVQPADMLCSYIRQPRALGLGHAVLCAEKLVGNEPFAVLLADDLMIGLQSGAGILSQMAQVFFETHQSVLAVQEVPNEQVHRYGIVSGQSLSEGRTQVKRIVEKPRAEQTDSRLAVAGRYILSPNIFDMIKTTGKGALGEIQLTDGISELLKHEGVIAYNYQGKRFDCGSKLGFLQATVELALRHPEVAEDFKTYLDEFKTSVSGV